MAEIHTKTCDVNFQNGKITIFHGRDSVTVDPDDKKDVVLAQEILWEIRNDAMEVGENRVKKQIRDLLGIEV